MENHNLEVIEVLRKWCEENPNKIIHKLVVYPSEDNEKIIYHVSIDYEEDIYVGYVKFDLAVY